MSHQALCTDVHGFFRSIFVVPPEDEFNCNICSNVVDCPKQCPEGHLFCNCCITSVLLEYAECPVCQVPLNVKSLSKSLFVQNAVDRMSTYCMSRNARNNCGYVDYCPWTGPMKSREAHYNVECDFFLLKCEMIGCEKLIQRRKLSDHMSSCPFRNVHCVFCDLVMQFKDLYQHESACDLRPVNCVNECGIVLACNDMTRHCATDCPLQLVDCPLAKLGLCVMSCPKELPRRDLREHVSGESMICDTVFNLSTLVVNEQTNSRHSAERLALAETRIATLEQQVWKLLETSVSTSAANSKDNSSHCVDWLDDLLAKHCRDCHIDGRSMELLHKWFSNQSPGYDNCVEHLMKHVSTPQSQGKVVHHIMSAEFLVSDVRKLNLCEELTVDFGSSVLEVTRMKNKKYSIRGVRSDITDNSSSRVMCTVFDFSSGQSETRKFWDKTNDGVEDKTGQECWKLEHLKRMSVQETKVKILMTLIAD